jgi:hypothetical protein
MMFLYTHFQMARTFAQQESAVAGGRHWRAGPALAFCQVFPCASPPGNRMRRLAPRARAQRPAHGARRRMGDWRYLGKDGSVMLLKNRMRSQRWPYVSRGAEARVLWLNDTVWRAAGW